MHNSVYIQSVRSRVERPMRATLRVASATLFLLFTATSATFAQTTFDNNTPLAIPDVATVESPLVVSGIAAPITKVTVSFHIVHTYDNDIDAFLVGPDGTTVELTTDNGGDGDNFGTSCAARTTFDDAAATSIAAPTAVAPYAGTFRPEGLLSAFNGKTGAAVNGTWRLRIVDDLANDIGTLQCWSLVITTAAPTTLQPPTELRATAIAGNQVTLRWTPPSGSIAPTNYVLEGGVNPGQTQATLPTGSASPIVTFSAPTGAFYVRLRAQAGSSSSGVSNEIRLFVNVPAAPSAPTNFQSALTGTTVGLAWRNTFTGGAPTSLVLDVTGSAITTIPLGLTESAAFTGVPGGTYTVSLRAVNATGSSTPSNSLTLTIPAAGCTGTPGTPTNFLAYKIGNTIYVVWDPAASGPASTGFVLTVTGSFAGSFPTTNRTLSGAVGPGSYGLSVVARNPCGSSAATPVQTVVIP
ncbi:MAG: proprotein convertase P-domain-containing protein [Vicinamibacterales bacterium]